jgi:lipopolysaccharide biosynthesis regulator YciM
MVPFLTLEILLAKACPRFQRVSRARNVDEAADALEEIEPENKTRKEVLGARVELYMSSKKWDMAAAVASHLVKVEPEEVGWWINLAYATRRS